MAAGGIGPDSIIDLAAQLFQSWTLWTAVIIVAEVLAIISLVRAIMTARTAAGAWAWSLALISFPFIAVPLFWIFGRKTFSGYTETLREAREQHEDLIEKITEGLEPHFAHLDGEQRRYGKVLQRLSERSFTDGNDVELLIDGPATFDAIFKAIEGATDYLLVQFFIIKDDTLGRKMQRVLVDKAKAGVRVYLIYDEIGSHRLPGRYIRELCEAGAQVTEFQTTRGKSNRFQVNFRNHRKIVVADGTIAFIGGHNVGDEYLGESKRYGPWRDTHVIIRGPAVLSTQLVFLGDWYWAVREVPSLHWNPKFPPCQSCMTVLPLPTGPVDETESGTLFFLNSITNAENRVWIASPYFVPDETIRSALQLASLRGVDVRVLIPDNPDKRMPWLASFSFLEEMEATGVRVFRYTRGFLHQKIILVDEALGCVTTANLDNRSLKLNFEVSAVVLDAEFCREVEAMLLSDFANAREVHSDDYTSKPLWFRILVRLARLAAPVL